MQVRRSSFALGTLLSLAVLATPGAAQGTAGVAFPQVGAVRPRAASEITASNWSVGAETMDRDFTIYRNWRQYLAPLGAKKARLQAGWAKTERQKGVYDWAWLDEIIPDMAAQGVEPWMNISYGNALYVGGGGTLLGGTLPATEEALQGWDRWVRALVERYGHHIDEWEVWNEANANGRNPAPAYAKLLLRTAEVIRAVQPGARILALANVGVGVAYADTVLGIAAEQGKLHLIDEVTYHPYNLNPDRSYPEVAALRALVHRYDPRIIIRQGENGAPSLRRRTKALSNHDWTEVSQSKWALRRLLGDLGRDIPSSYFSLVDLRYPDEMNAKGLVRANDDKTIAGVKPAYRAVQHLTAIFDDRLRRIPGYAYRAGTDRSLSGFGYADRATGLQVATLWFDGEIPGDAPTKTPVDVTITSGHFRDPVWVDLREGTVHEIPRANWSRSGSTHVFRGVPLYDSPVLIADRSLVPLRRETPRRVTATPTPTP